MNKHHSPLNQPPLPQLLSETLEYKDMVGIVKPTIHVDEFASKMGDDADIIVVSFFVRSKQAATDLVNWFEKGYDWVLDADQSPGEIRPGRYLVYLEMRRRSSAPRNLALMLDDMNTLTEHTGNDWVMHYEDKEVPFTAETFERMVPTSPKQYRKVKESGLNEWRRAAGIEVKQIYERERDIRQLQSAAGI
jgi:hypothetical protein